jgi:hypothetical protein
MIYRLFDTQNSCNCKGVHPVNEFSHLTTDNIYKLIASLNITIAFCYQEIYRKNEIEDNERDIQKFEVLKAEYQAEIERRIKRQRR